MPLIMSNASRRVVITGAGLISPLGNNKQALWEALQAGRSGVRSIQCLPAEALPFKCAAEAWDFRGKIEDFGDLSGELKRTIRKGLKVMCREIQMGVASAQLALQDAGLKTGAYDVNRTGAVYGSDYIVTEPQEFVEGVRHCLNADGQFDFSRWPTDGLSQVTPLWLLKYLPNMPASHIAIYNDMRGPNNSITLREASSNLAVAEAFCTIQRGTADIMLAGATGTRLHPLRTIHTALQEQIANGNEAPERLCRPFDLNRQGMVLGEGAATIVLEELHSAQSRGATIMGEVLGYGSSAVMTPEGTGNSRQALQNVMVQALRKAGVAPSQLGHIHAHGLATRHDDIEEAAAIQAVLGADAQKVPVTAAKSYLGNLGAAGGMVELIASLLATQHDHLFPILNFETPDPACPIRAARGSDLSPGSCFLNLSVTPHGQASAILIRAA
jgi:3-oxoacyl-[acyl-carrier-protein] synthase II